MKMYETGILAILADKVGSTEPALRLLVSLILGYPISYIHRKYLYGKNPNIQHIYFICTGLLLGLFNFGWDTWHSLCSISVVYVVLRVLGGGSLSLSIIFLYTMGHLLVGYWVTATGDYDIKWTMPHCVLTLRLIGLAFNMSDGTVPPAALSGENKEVALRSMPSLLEVFAHSLFPSSYLIGPQFPLTKYRDFVELKLEKKALARSKTQFKVQHRENLHEPPRSVVTGLLRGSLGLGYLAVYMVGVSYLSDEYVISDEFYELAAWQRYLLLGLWARFTLYKYISCWLVTEGACILVGITYNGVDEKGMAKWDGCSNVKIRVFENATKMDHYIDSFNINTNHWVAQYIYKRLKFFNSKVISQFGVLFFLSVWHGFHSGYYICFFYEFISILAEKNLTLVLSRNEKLWSIIYSWPLNILTYLVLRVYTLVSMGYAMVPFILLSYDKYMPHYTCFRFSMHLMYLVIIFSSPYLGKYVLRPRRRGDSGDRPSPPDGFNVSSNMGAQRAL